MAYIPDTHTTMTDAQMKAYNQAGAVTGAGPGATQGWVTAPNGQTYLIGDNNHDQANVDSLTARTYGYQGQQQKIAGAMGETANGSSYRGQMRNAGALEAFGQAPTGPSAAELAMRQQSSQAMQGNLAMAATGTGASSNSLMLNAMNRNAQQQGALAQQVGVQRAAETQAQRGQQMAALQGAAGLYGQAGQMQQNAYQGQAGIVGNVAGQNNQLASMYAGVGQANQQNATQLAQLKQQQDQYDSSRMDKYIGGAASAAGGMMAMSDIRAKTDIAPAGGQISDAFGNIGSSGYGYARLGDAGQDITPFNDSMYGAARIGDAGQDITPFANSRGQLVTSDIRMKTDVQPAGGDISGTFGNLSGSSYGYTNPAMGQGTHYGPMAQELAQTPAGASAVVPTQNGLAVDAGRLAMMNASETGQQRRELDALKSQITGTTSGGALGNGPVAGVDKVSKTGKALSLNDADAKKKAEEEKKKARQSFGGALSAFGDAVSG